MSSNALVSLQFHLLSIHPSIIHSFIFWFFYSVNLISIFHSIHVFNVASYLKSTALFSFVFTNCFNNSCPVRMIWLYLTLVQYSFCFCICFFLFLPMCQWFQPAFIHLSVASTCLHLFASCFYLFLFIYQSFLLISICLQVVSICFYPVYQSFQFVLIRFLLTFVG